MREAVIVKQLGKRFDRYRADRPVTLMEAALSGLHKLKPQDYFWALRHVSFTVAPGQMLGVIGKNGAGKSTLLQLIGGIGHPDEGKVKINGRVGALLDLGAGLSTDLTGRENVFVSAVVAGLTRRETQKRFDAIVEFAELEQFIDNPVRTYSTGMQMRLAFSVAIHTNPEILLIDEFLSVGDMSFQTKCLDRITRLKSEGCAIVYISHSVEQMQELCDDILWLRKGQVIAHGEPEVVIGQYIAETRSETQKRTPQRPPQLTEIGTELRVNENRFGSLEIEITNVRLLPDTEIGSGDPLCIEIEYWAEQPINAPIFGVTISCEDGQTCFETSTQTMGLNLRQIQGSGKIQLSLDRLDLTSGKYFIDVGVYETNWEYAYDSHWHVYPLFVHSAATKAGILHPPHCWRVSDVTIHRLRNYY